MALEVFIGNPKYIVVMFNTIRDLLMTVIHESIHCLIEKPIIQKYELINQLRRTARLAVY